MADMMPTLRLTVNLQCKLCRRKIRKVLGKLEDRGKIQPPKYNDEEGTVIFSGPFDPEKLSKKLCCKACKVIKDIQIVEKKPDSKLPDRSASPTESKPQKPEYIYLYPYPYPYPQPYSYPCPTVWPFIPRCGCNGSCHCKSIVDAPPPPPPPIIWTPYYDGCRSCKFICEEEPSTCSIM